MKKFTALLILLVATAAMDAPALFVSADGVKKVVIDAGHGGKDPGNLGTKRLKKFEKDVALQVSMDLGQKIKEKYPDVEVIYTRKSDHFVELRERTAIANAAKADLFISIHCDAAASPQAYGASSIVMGKDHSDENMAIAMRENSVIFLEENYEEKYEGFDPTKPETYIALTLYQNAFLEQSIEMAAHIQEAFREQAGRKDRGVKQQPLYVTSRTTMPSVLVELGYLTNKDEENFLHSAEGQEKMTQALLAAFSTYKENRDKREINLVKEPIEPLKVDKPMTIVFKVQIGISSKLKELRPSNFHGLDPVDFYRDGNLYKYTYGSFPTLDEAEKAQAIALQKGAVGAFVVAFEGENRIPVAEARKKAQQ
jgi:N-acetylmuramoyl-L-alanine amidase